MNMNKNKKTFLTKFTVTALTAALIFASFPMTAFADDLTPVDNQSTASNVTPADTGSADAAASDASAIPVIESGLNDSTTSGIESAAVGSSTGSTAASSSGSSNVVVAGSSASGPSSTGSDSSTSRGNVIMAGSGTSSVISTVAEQGITYPDILGGATLIMFDSVSAGQILSCMIQTNDGSLIIVDGGYGEDADYLTSQIVARGGHVAAWLITHPHADHAGALYTILQNQDACYAAGIEPQVTIDGIYYSFGDANWYLTYDPDESTMAIALLGELAGRPDTMLHSVHQGETFQVDTATIQVMNDRYQGSTNYGNNASIVYKITINGVSILFLGDLSEEGGNYLLQTVNPLSLRSDIVQMAHHGQTGVNQEFYQAVSPSICLWPTPDWLWVSQESKYTIQQTKQWMADLGVQRHYCTKDGDQVIR